MKLNLTLVALVSALALTQLSCEARGAHGHGGGGHSAPAIKSTPPPPPAKPTGSAGTHHGRRGLGRGRRIGGTGDLDQANNTDDTNAATSVHNVDPSLPHSAFVKTYGSVKAK
jgi:hypothetical protein